MCVLHVFGIGSMYAEALFNLHLNFVCHKRYYFMFLQKGLDGA